VPKIRGDHAHTDEMEDAFNAMTGNATSVYLDALENSSQPVVRASIIEACSKRRSCK